MACREDDRVFAAGQAKALLAGGGVRRLCYLLESGGTRCHNLRNEISDRNRSPESTGQYHLVDQWQFRAISQAFGALITVGLYIETPPSYVQSRYQF